MLRQSVSVKTEKHKLGLTDCTGAIRAVDCAAQMKRWAKKNNLLRQNMQKSAHTLKNAHMHIGFEKGCHTKKSFLFLYHHNHINMLSLLNSCGASLVV